MHLHAMKSVRGAEGKRKQKQEQKTNEKNYFTKPNECCSCLKANK